MHNASSSSYQLICLIKVNVKNNNDNNNNNNNNSNDNNKSKINYISTCKNNSYNSKTKAS